MNYTALYRKFRPMTFDEMVGQEHITKTLKNQISAGRVGHAYLFNGGRGTGKTSSAKILARAINCLNPKDGEPCNECEICKEAINGSLTDIVEMDAASNNGVDDIRQIREEVNFLPTKAKYRVYIIDEVHMLSLGAFNALLKTLEEPPEHVKFILATTEPQKLPATILSRCQRFDFKQVSNENIIKRLKIVCDEMKIEITDEALNIIAVLAEGGMRDALSILERCLQDGETKINEDKVKDLVGIPKLEYINKIVNSIVEKDVNTALEVIDKVTLDGKDIQNFLWEIIKYVKDILVYKASKKLEIYSKDEIEDIKVLSDKFSKEKLLSIIYSLSELENDIKYSSQKIVLFQVEIIKLCSMEDINKNSYNVENTNKGQANIGFKVENSTNTKNTANVQSAIAQKNIDIQGNTLVQDNVNTNNINKNNISANNEAVAKAKPSVEIGNVAQGEKIKAWPKIVSELKDSGKIMLYTNLVNSTASKINDMVIGIQFTKKLTPFGKSVVEKSESINELERRLSIECGKPMKVKYLDNSEQSVKKEEVNPIESFALGNDIPFNVVE